MADFITYSIHTPVTDEFFQTNPNTLETNTFTGTSGEVSDAWDDLTIDDGTGGFIDSDLVHSATYYEDDAPNGQTYLISENYDFAAIVASRVTGVTANPVTGEIALPAEGGGTVTSFSAGALGFSVANPTTTPALSGTLIAAHGGTGATSLTDHGVLFGSDTAAITASSAGTAGQLLASGGASADPGWITSVPVANGGTGASTLTSHGIVIGQGTSAVHITSAGTAGQVLTSGGASADPDWVDLVPVANGGTGAATLADHGVLLGSGTGAISVTSAGTVGQVLTSGGASADPTWAAPVAAPPTAVIPGTGLTGDVDGINDTFVIDAGTPQLLQLFRNGQLQDTFSVSPDYTLTDDTIVFDTPPSEGDDLVGYIW